MSTVPKLSASPIPRMMFHVVLLAVSTLKAIMMPASAIMMVDMIRATVNIPFAMVVRLFWKALSPPFSPMSELKLAAADAVVPSARTRTATRTNMPSGRMCRRVSVHRCISTTPFIAVP